MVQAVTDNGGEALCQTLYEHLSDVDDRKHLAGVASSRESKNLTATARRCSGGAKNVGNAGPQHGDRGTLVRRPD